jgi:hypothetical protein
MNEIKRGTEGEMFTAKNVLKAAGIVSADVYAPIGTENDYVLLVLDEADIDRAIEVLIEQE